MQWSPLLIECEGEITHINCKLQTNETLDQKKLTNDQHFKKTFCKVCIDRIKFIGRNHSSIITTNPCALTHNEQFTIWDFFNNIYWPVPLSAQNSLVWDFFGTIFTGLSLFGQYYLDCLFTCIIFSGLCLYLHNIYWLVS